MDEIDSNSQNFIDQLNKINDDNDNDDDDNNVLPITERWDPLGADNDDDDDNNKDSNKSIDHIDHTNVGIEIGLCGIPSNGLTTLMHQFDISDNNDINRIKSLEDEQEMLTTSLMSLTSHFAQVQFRLRQIVEAAPNERDILLKNLEEFAFRGIPEITTKSDNTNSNDDKNDENQSIESARQKQNELIERLKQQLSELEKFAYESGTPGILPQSIILEKQKFIIDELKNKLNLNVNDIDLPKLTIDDLRNHVDTAIGEFVGPLKMKEQLVLQLKTQITDLERFIAFLQCDNDCKIINLNKKSSIALQSNNNLAYNSYSAKKKNEARIKSNSIDTKTPKISPLSQLPSSSSSPPPSPITTTTNSSTAENHLPNITLNKKAHNLLDKATTILQMFALSQFGCSSSLSSSSSSSSSSSRTFHKNTLKRTQFGNHWGDIRAQLELDVQEIISLVRTLNLENENAIKSSKKLIKGQTTTTTTTTTSSLSSSSFQSLQPITSQYYGKSLTISNSELTTLIRCNLSMTLQKLIQHGLRRNYNHNSTTNNLIVPFIGCFNGTTSSTTTRTTKNYNNLNKMHKDQEKYNYKKLNKIKNDINYDSSSSSISSSSSSSLSSNDDNNDDNDKFYLNHNYDDQKQMHAWQLILKYYEIKNGENYNDTPACRLSQSFNLDIIGTQTITNKQSLLCCIGNIIAIHLPYKRSLNSHFKAFICAALNSHKLVQWLNLIFQCDDLIRNCYEPWAYVIHTGFRDALRTIDYLTKYDFNLPVDLAIRQFQNIKDVFM